MYRKIYSKVNPEKLLHIIFDEHEIMSRRRELTSPNELLQISTWMMPQDKLFSPHKHIPKLVPMTEIPTQEAIVILSGLARGYYYDIDNSFLEHHDLTPGTVTITIEGGHAYKSFVPGTRVFEFKSGPYYDREKDKEFIEDPLCGY